jgi:hypothetical protein
MAGILSKTIFSRFKLSYTLSVNPADPINTFLPPPPAELTLIYREIEYAAKPFIIDKA